MLQIEDKALGELLGKGIKVFIVPGVAITGTLKEFDASALYITPGTVVRRVHVTTFHPWEDKHAR